MSGFVPHAKESRPMMKVLELLGSCAFWTDHCVCWVEEVLDHDETGSRKICEQKKVIKTWTKVEAKEVEG